jgi:hypothetical protein
MNPRLRDDSAYGFLTAKTMWALLERFAELERRVGALYDRFAQVFQHLPLVAAFWREMADEERLHAVIIAAAREIFPATEPAMPGNWTALLAEVDALLSAHESKAAAGLGLAEAFACADELEASELNTVTAMTMRHAARGFSRLEPLLGLTGVDRHRGKVLEARQRFVSELSNGS